MSRRRDRAPALWGALAIAWLGGLAACPEVTTEPPEPIGPFDRYLAASCAALERCADSHGRAYPNARVCVDQLRARVDCGMTLRDPLRHEAFELVRSWRGGDGLEDCLAWLAGTSCDALHRAEAPVCRQLLAYRDGLPEGARCDAWQDLCQVGLACARPGDDGICAVCTAAIGAGQGCDLTRPACDEGLFCAPASATCEPLGNGGAPCSDDGHCLSGRCAGASCSAPGLRDSSCSDNDGCAWELRCVAGRCGDGLDEGASCQHSGECLRGLFCVEGLCRAYSLCADLGRGEACPFPFDTCDWNGYCSPITGRCEGEAYAYDECSYVNWECLGDLYCDFSESPAECARRKELGEPCSVDRECDSAHCAPGSRLCSTPPTCSMP